METYRSPIGTNKQRKEFREEMNRQEEKRIEAIKKANPSISEDSIKIHVRNEQGNGNKNQYKPRKRKYGDYLYFQDRELFEHSFENWMNDKLNSEVSKE